MVGENLVVCYDGAQTTYSIELHHTSLTLCQAAKHVTADLVPPYIN